MREDFTYPSADGRTMIHAVRWTPEGEPRAVLQIIHGMVEFIGRYERFAEYLAAQGYVVTGEDHLGHGQSVVNDSELGYFGKGGNALVIRDIHTLHQMTRDAYPDLPYIMLGHSMGSFLVRQYIVEGNPVYSSDLTAVIAMGTGWQPTPVLKLGRLVSGVSSMFGGEHYRSRFVEKMAMGANNRRIKNPRTKDDWLTKDTEIVDWYVAEPLCQFHFTVNAYYNMFKGMERCQNADMMAKLPKGMPLLLVSGAEDPVGNYGDGVRKAYMAYLEHSPCDVYIKLYEEDRHEILNETNYEVVFAELLEWMDRCIER